MSAVGEGDTLVNIVLILWTSFCLLLGAMVGWTCHACRPWRIASFVHRGGHGCSAPRPQKPTCSKGAGKGPPPRQNDTESDSADLTPRVSDVDSPRSTFMTHCKFEQTDPSVAAAIRKRDKKRHHSPSCNVPRCPRTPPGSPPPKGRQIMYHTDAKNTMVHTDPHCRQLKGAKLKVIQRPVCSVRAPCGVAAG